MRARFIDLYVYNRWAHERVLDAGFETVQPLGATLTHVANHATYHRGQVTNLLRQLSAEPVATDYLLYFDAVVMQR